MRKLTTEEFIKKAKAVHGNKYDYSKVEYINSRTKICIICPKHGEFWITPHSHLTGHGCHKCSCKYVLSTEEFVKRAREIHGNKYDYSKVEYKNYDTKVCIICPKHGEFWQMPHSHLQGNGCTVCGKLKLRGLFQKKYNEFIEQAKEVHGDKYDYSKVEYINANTKVCIICPKHGEFWQTPDNHLHKQGCPNCITSVLENDFDKFLKENNINSIFQKRFKWLGKQSLDFYLPDYNIGIECQGRQHFQIVSHFGGESGLDKTIRRDKIKFDKCNKRGICLCYYITNEIDENTIIDNEFYGKIYRKNNIFKKIDYILTKIKEVNLVKPK